MNSVDIYVNGFRLDLFDDEEISINLSVQNLQDISKVFTDFTQGFTVPASPRNNEILQHYYNSNITQSTITTEAGGWQQWQQIVTNWNSLTTLWNAQPAVVSTPNTFDGRLRQPARIEINSLPFRTGVIELENVQLKGTEPYAYTLTFYGELVSLTDLFGEDYLYDLAFPDSYNHNYTDNAIYERFTTDNHPVFYPMMSPVKNWYYDSNSANDDVNNIAYNFSAQPHGINYFELKPAVKVTSILEAIEAKYGITFTGSFLSATPFADLSLWLHRTEGYIFDNSTTIDWQLVNFNRNIGGGTEFNLSTDTWVVQTTDFYQINIGILNADAAYEVGLFSNGELVASFQRSAHPSSSISESFIGLGFNAGDVVQLFIRPLSPVSFNYQFVGYQAVSAFVNHFQVDQTLAALYPFSVIISNLMPEIKVREFLAGIVKMYNLVIIPNSSTSFLLQPLDDWYAAGSDVNYQNYFDITEYAVNRPPLYREIEFKYQETEQILGFQYRKTNNTGFGDLRNTFAFDGDEFIVEVPFECPLYERLIDQNNGSLTNVLVYKSITQDANNTGEFNPYLGAPILFYAYYDHDIDANAISFIDSDGTTQRPTSTVWYANTSNTPVSAGAAFSICFGADIDPYHLQSITRSLYNTEWVNYITDLYNRKRRVLQVEAVLPVGAMLNLDLKNEVIWNNNKYLVNNVSLNMTTGRATFELLNVV